MLVDVVSVGITAMLCGDHGGGRCSVMYGVFGAHDACLACDVAQNCSAGFICPSVGAISATTAICAAGKYSLSGSSVCTNCTAGYICPSDGAPIATNVTCPAGRFALSGSVACSNCSSGYACPAASATSTPAAAICALGRYSFSGWTACSVSC